MISNDNPSWVTTLDALEATTCKPCHGVGVFPGATPKAQKPEPDQRCGQCNGHGVVWRKRR